MEIFGHFPKQRETNVGRISVNSFEVSPRYEEHRRDSRTLYKGKRVLIVLTDKDLEIRQIEILVFVTLQLLTQSSRQNWEITAFGIGMTT
jgi:hypothetical protein